MSQPTTAEEMRAYTDEHQPYTIGAALWRMRRVAEAGQYQHRFPPFHLPEQVKFELVQLGYTIEEPPMSDDNYLVGIYITVSW